MASAQRIYRIAFGNQPPQHFPGKDGKPTGLVVELINEAAKRRRIHLQWSMEPESSEAALKMNKVDLWPIMTIRPERKGVVYITDPYREDTICLLVRNTSAFTRLQDLGDARIAFEVRRIITPRVGFISQPLQLPAVPQATRNGRSPRVSRCSQPKSSRRALERSTG